MFEHHFSTHLHPLFAGNNENYDGVCDRELRVSASINFRKRNCYLVTCVPSLLVLYLHPLFAGDNEKL